MKRVGVLLAVVFCMTFVLSEEFEVITFCNEDLPEGYELSGGLLFSDEVLNFYVAEQGVGHVVLMEKKVVS